MILYRAPWYYYVSTIVTLGLEISIMYSAPFVIWAFTLPWAAGDTFLSEYAIVIALRWTVVFIFQLPMLLSCLAAFVSSFQLIVYGLRRVLLLANKVRNGRNRNPNGTFAPDTDEEQIPIKRRGRPTKTRTA